MKKEALPMDKVNLISTVPYNKIIFVTQEGAVKDKNKGLKYQRNWADNDYKITDSLNNFLKYLEEFGQEPIDSVYLQLAEPYNTVHMHGVHYNFKNLLVALSERYGIIFYIPEKEYKELAIRTVNLASLVTMSSDFNSMKGKTFMYDGGPYLRLFSKTDFKEENKENVLSNPLLLIDNLSKETGFSIPASKQILKLFQRKIKRLSDKQESEGYFVIEDGDVSFVQHKPKALNFDDFLPDILEEFIDLSDEISLRIKEKDYEEMNRNEKAILNRYILMAIQEYVNQNAHYDDKKGKIRGKNPFIKKAEEDVQQGLKDSKIIPEYTDYGDIDDAFELLEDKFNETNADDSYDWESNIVDRIRGTIHRKLEEYLKDNFSEIYNLGIEYESESEPFLPTIEVTYRSYVGGDTRQKRFVIKFTVDRRVYFTGMDLAGSDNSKSYTVNPFRPMVDIMLFVNSALGRETSSKIPINVTPGFRREGIAQRADVVALDFFNREIDRNQNNPNLVLYEKLSMNTLTGTVKGGALIEYYNHGLVLLSGDTQNNPYYGAGEMVICSSLIYAQFDGSEIELYAAVPSCIHTESWSNFYIGDAHAGPLVAYLFSRNPEGPKTTAHLYAPRPLIINGKKVDLKKLIKDNDINYRDFKVSERIYIDIDIENIPFVEE